MPQMDDEEFDGCLKLRDTIIWPEGVMSTGQKIQVCSRGYEDDIDPFFHIFRFIFQLILMTSTSHIGRVQ